MSEAERASKANSLGPEGQSLMEHFAVMRVVIFNAYLDNQKFLCKFILKLRDDVAVFTVQI